MNRTEAAARIAAHKLIPVIRADSAEQALQAAETLVEAGLAVLEITMTVPGALACISELRRRHGGAILVGAGTVLNPAACREAVAAGAQFIVSPGLNLEVIASAQAQDATMLAGALTPTEVMTAAEAGADFIKIFPCDAVGGPAYIKALRGPFPKLKLVPTGGVSEETAEAFLRAGASALGLGGGLIPAAEMRAGQWDRIRARAQRLLGVVAGEGKSTASNQ